MTTKKYRVYRPSWSVIVRATDEPTARTRAYEILADNEDQDPEFGELIVERVRRKKRLTKEEIANLTKLLRMVQSKKPFQNNDRVKRSARATLLALSGL